MTQELISQLLEKSISVAVLAIGGYFIIRYFMNQITLERSQNQANLLQFVQLIKESNQVHSKTAETLQTVAVQNNDLHRKVDALKEAMSELRHECWITT